MNDRHEWPEFLEKMWQLRSYLDATKKLCEDRF
jgi:hypothetical protein